MDHCNNPQPPRPPAPHLPPSKLPTHPPLPGAAAVGYPYDNYSAPYNQAIYRGHPNPTVPHHGYAASPSPSPAHGKWSNVSEVISQLDSDKRRHCAQFQLRCRRFMGLDPPLQRPHFRTRSRNRRQERPRCRSPTPSRPLRCPRAALVTLLPRRRACSTAHQMGTARGTARTPPTTSSCGSTRTGSGGTKPGTVAPENLAEGVPETRGAPENQGNPEARGNRGMEAAGGEAEVLVNQRAR